MGEENPRDSEKLKALKQQLAAAAPTSPADETPEGIGRQREILRQMDAQRSKDDWDRNMECNRAESAREADRLSRLRTDGGGS
jgi:hypothetical protein